MPDNLYPESGSDELRMPELPEMPERANAPRNAPMADREIPLEGGHPALLVQQWLDGEATEAAARRDDVHDVELWQLTLGTGEGTPDMPIPLDRLAPGTLDAAAALGSARLRL